MNLENKRIPLFLEYKNENLYFEILHYLHSNNFVKDKTKLNEDWLKIQLLKGKFLILIDDIHKNSSTSKLTELLDYKENNFILVSRETSNLLATEFPLYKFSNLSKEEIINILKLNVEENTAQYLYRSYFHSNLNIQLFSTPQLLTFLTTYYINENKLIYNKSILFDRIIEQRLSKEINTIVYTTHILKLYLANLSDIMFKNNSNPYIINKQTCISEFIKLNNNINKEYHLQINLEHILDKFQEIGILSITDNYVKYEHDQWQEFFYAYYLFLNKKSITELINKNYFYEIVYFVSGFLNFDGEFEHKLYFEKFYNELIKLDYVYINKCFENYRTYETLREWLDIHQNVNITKDRLRMSYEKYLHSYEKIINSIFPKLRCKFSPQTDKKMSYCQ